MEINKILKADALDIIFEQRNKSYGAYELRKNYHRRARRSVSIVGLLFMLTASAPLVASWIWDKPTIVHLPKNPTTTVICEIKPIDPVIPKPKVQVVKQTMPCATVSHTIPKIIRSEEVKDDEIMKPQQELVGKTIGVTDIEGPTNDDPIGSAPVEGSPEGKGIIESPVMTEEPETVVFSEVMPEYPGGEDALNEFLKSNMKYPKSALNNDKEGRVIVGFTVNSQGKIQDVHIKRGLGYGCDEEAQRVIQLMPKWTPGSNNGKRVNVQYELPIEFELE